MGIGNNGQRDAVLLSARGYTASLVSCALTGLEDAVGSVTREDGFS
jgi:hypothetical protein